MEGSWDGVDGRGDAGLDVTGYTFSVYVSLIYKDFRPHHLASQSLGFISLISNSVDPLPRARIRPEKVTAIFFCPQILLVENRSGIFSTAKGNGDCT